MKVLRKRKTMQVKVYQWWLLAAGFMSLLLNTMDQVAAISLEADELEAWRSFKQQFNKTYQLEEEERRRLTIFLENKRYIESQNLKAAASSFEQAINQLSDLTPEEVNESRCGFRLDQLSSSANFFDFADTSSNLLTTLLRAFNVTDENEQQPSNANELPVKHSRAWYENLLSKEELDYRQQGFVSRVKDQGDCGSCWAFATTGALESQLAQRGRQVLLSEQQLVDCSRIYGNHGCQGGLMNLALRYVRDHGLMASRDYPYAATDNKCKSRANLAVTRVHGYAMLPHGNEALLRVALALTGPIPVALDAGARSFHSYKSGVYDDTVCRNSQHALNHAVLLVGYGTSKTGGDYWILKNSWGRSWGDNGYIKMARNRHNLCGVASFAVLPIP